MASAIHVTGFGPFLDVEHNHTADLARDLSPDSHTVLPVCYAAVEDFLRGYRLERREPLLMLGVARTNDLIHIERTARNLTSELPDADGVILSGTQLSTSEPGAITNDLATQIALRSMGTYEVSDDAGAYLCNYIFFRAVTEMPVVPSLFVHVPPIDKISYDEQLEALVDIRDTMIELT